MSEIPDNAPSPRLCIIVKWPDFEGYGFNLHAEKSKPGQYIGKVDPGSPAEMAGLKEGDRIIEVNAVNIANENHKQVVQRIKSVANETRLLVVDLEADQYYKEKNIVVKGTQANVITGTSVREPTPPPVPKTEAPYTNGHHREDADNRSVSSAASSSAASEGSTLPQPAATHEEASGDVTTHLQQEDEKEEVEHNVIQESAPTPKPEEEGDNSSVEETVQPSVEEVPPPPVELISGDSSDDKPLEGDVKPPVEEDASSSEGNPENGVEETAKEVVDAPKEAILSAKEPESGLDAKADEGVVAETVEKYDDTTPASTSRRSSSASSCCSASSSSSSTASQSSDTAHTENTTQSPMSTSPTPPPSLDNTVSKTTPTPTPTPAPRPTPPPVTTTTTTTTSAANKPSPQPVSKNTSFNTGGLNLNMSAAEMRAVLARKKKTDPRKDSLDLRKKYEIIQNM